MSIYESGYDAVRKLVNESLGQIGLIGKDGIDFIDGCGNYGFTSDDADALMAEAADVIISNYDRNDGFFDSGQSDLIIEFAVQNVAFEELSDNENDRLIEAIEAMLIVFRARFPDEQSEAA